MSRNWDEVVISGCVFEGNVGTLGGAVYFNGPLGGLKVEKSSFKGNMAYLSGNGLYISGTR